MCRSSEAVLGWTALTAIRAACSSRWKPAAMSWGPHASITSTRRSIPSSRFSMAVLIDVRMVDVDDRLPGPTGPTGGPRPWKSVAGRPVAVRRLPRPAGRRAGLRHTPAGGREPLWHAARRPLRAVRGNAAPVPRSLHRPRWRIPRQGVVCVRPRPHPPVPETCPAAGSPVSGPPGAISLIVPRLDVMALTRDAKLGRNDPCGRHGWPPGTAWTRTWAATRTAARSTGRARRARHSCAP
jgi:hypothetical protein